METCTLDNKSSPQSSEFALVFFGGEGANLICHHHTLVRFTPKMFAYIACVHVYGLFIDIWTIYRYMDYSLACLRFRAGMSCIADGNIDELLEAVVYIYIY